MGQQRTKTLNDKQYTYRNTFPREIALKIAKELRNRGFAVELTKESDDLWLDTAIWCRRE